MYDDDFRQFVLIILFFLILCLPVIIILAFNTHDQSTIHFFPTCNENAPHYFESHLGGRSMTEDDVDGNAVAQSAIKTGWVDIVIHHESGSTPDWVSGVCEAGRGE